MLDDGTVVALRQQLFPSHATFVFEDWENFDWDGENDDGSDDDDEAGSFHHGAAKASHLHEPELRMKTTTNGKNGKKRMSMRHPRCSCPGT